MSINFRVDISKNFFEVIVPIYYTSHYRRGSKKKYRVKIPIFDFQIGESSSRSYDNPLFVYRLARKLKECIFATLFISADSQTWVNHYYSYEELDQFAKDFGLKIKGKRGK